MEVFKSNEEGAEARAEDEGAAREDQGNEAERSAAERAPDGPAAAHEGRQSARRVFAAADPDAFPVCTLSRDHDLARLSTGELPLDSRPFSGRALPDTHL